MTSQTKVGGKVYMAVSLNLPLLTWSRLAVLSRTDRTGFTLGNHTVRASRFPFFFGVLGCGCFIQHILSEKLDWVGQNILSGLNRIEPN